MMIKLRYSKRLFKRSSSSSKQQAAARGDDNGSDGSAGAGEIEWEVRPGGMLVQKREEGRGGQETVTVRVSTGFSCHHVSIGATSTFGEYTAPASLSVLSPSRSRSIDGWIPFTRSTYFLALLKC